MLEIGQDKRGAGDVTDLAGADGDVLQGTPAAGEQGEPTFPQAAQRAERALRARVLISSSCPPGGCLTGM
jgi:hypothetical protein